MPKQLKKTDIDDRIRTLELWEAHKQAGGSRGEFCELHGIPTKKLKWVLETARKERNKRDGMSLGTDGYWRYRIDDQIITKKWEDCIITGDWQIPTTDWYFVERIFQVAERFNLKKIVLAGDVMNLDAFSTYASIIRLPDFEQEKEQARLLLTRLEKVFDEIVFLPGNHELRILKTVSGAFGFDDFVKIIHNSGKLQTSIYDRMFIENSGGRWCVMHGSEYSVNALTVANQYAQKYQSHIISHHEHHVGKSMDRYGRYVLINNGGLFDYANMVYAQIRANKRNVMKPGFTVMLDGRAHLLAKDESYTDWSLWT